MLTNPLDTVVVEHLQVARLVILYQQLKDALLARILSYGLGLLQPIDDMADGIAIEAVGLPYTFTQRAIGILHQGGVETVGGRCLQSRIGLLLPGIVLFGLLLSDASAIEIAGRSQYQVFTIGLVDAPWKHLWVEDDGEQLVAHIIDTLPLPDGQSARLHQVERLSEPLWREGRHEFLRAVVMIDAAGEPYTLQIDLHGLEVWRAVVDVHICIYCLQHFADAEIVLAILVKGDVSTKKCRLGQIEHQCLLPKRQFFETVQSIAVAGLQSAHPDS